MPDICPKTGYKHIPNWDNLIVTSEADNQQYLVIVCADCKQLGTVGEIKVLEETITWEE